MKENIFNILIIFLNIIFLLLSPFVFTVGGLTIMAGGSGQGLSSLIAIPVYIWMAYPVLSFYSFARSVGFLKRKDKKKAIVYSFLPLLDIVLGALAILLISSLNSWLY